MAFSRNLSCAKWSVDARSALHTQRAINPVAAAVSAALPLDASGTPLHAALGFFLGSDHGHEPFLDRVRGFRRAQAQCERFVQGVALGQEVFAFLPEFLSSFLEFLRLFRLQRADDVQSRLILE